MISGKLEISTPSLFGGLNSVRFAGGEITVGENKTLGMKSLAWKNGRFVFKIYSDVTNDCGAIRIDDTAKLAGGKYYIDLVLDEKIRNIIGSYNIIRGGHGNAGPGKAYGKGFEFQGRSRIGNKDGGFQEGRRTSCKTGRRYRCKEIGAQTDSQSAIKKCLKNLS